jgi:NADH-quinone oxidoreductase subunit L
MDHALSVRLILLLPLAGAVLNGMLGLFVPSWRQREGVIGALATACVVVPFLLAIGLFLAVGDAEGAIVTRFFTWLQAGDLDVSFAYRVDELSILMTLIITGVGALIHLYSMGYMKGDSGYWRFFAYLNLFIFAMLNLVLGDNLPVLFLGWEGVGLCSYLLIGFWYSDLKNSAAANKAFIVNRVGDFAFLLAMFIIFDNLRTLDFGPIIAYAQGLTIETAPGWVNWVVLLLFIGATGKSAQIPLFVWLPDAMAGPTPVSALIHAATMVTSGLYLLARLSSMVLLAPTMMAVVAITGAVTAIMAASIAMTQNDIKKVLAYSTVSQLGYMFMAAGVGAFFVAIFHVMTHAFFKACLFLGSGSVIHAMHHVEHDLEHKGLLPGHADPHDTPHDSEARENTLRHDPLPYDGPFDAQDMRTMGGLASQMKVTNITFLISTLAIAGLFPLSGFFSKDEILFKAFESGYNGVPWAWFVWIVGILTAFLTAVYMTRCYLLTFKGKSRWPGADKVHAHESPTSMTIPLVVLAFLAAVTGFLGLPAVLGEKVNWMKNWLVGYEYGGPVAYVAKAHHVPHGMEWGLLFFGFAIAVGGIGYAWSLYGNAGPAYDKKVRKQFGKLYQAASEKYNWDEFYQRTIRGPILGASEGSSTFDKRVIDGSVMGIGTSLRAIGSRVRLTQSGVVGSYAVALVLGVALVIALVLFV